MFTADMHAETDCEMQGMVLKNELQQIATLSTQDHQ